MFEDVEWAIPMGEFIYFLGREKAGQTELVRYNPVSKELYQSVLKTQGYFAYLAWRTKHHLVMILINPKAKQNKHRLGIVPKGATNELKVHDLPPDFDVANPYFFLIFLRSTAVPAVIFLVIHFRELLNIIIRPLIPL